MKELFQTFSFRPTTVELIDMVNVIVGDYTAQGFKLTLRQLYYQFVARDLFPESWADPKSGTKNTTKNYKKLGDLVNNGRLAGLIDWDAIEDRTRNLEKLMSWKSGRDRLYSAYRSFHMSMWANQPSYCEVWVEKEALVGVVERICDQYDVPYFACRGFVSQSEMYTAAKRLEKHLLDGKAVTVFHLGDHDPSGLDMTRDNSDRLDMFLRNGRVGVDRLALNWEQIELYNPPPNPAKATDSRFQGYQREFGDESWELDALEPSVISNLIETSISGLISWQEWDDRKDEIAAEREKLAKTYRHWEYVVKFLEDKK